MGISGGRAGRALLLLAAAAVASGCQTETRATGRDAFSAAEAGGWRGTSSGEGDDADPYGYERRGPDEAVDVPVRAFRPVGEFLDGEGYLLGDRVEIDCSFEPFMARFAAIYPESRGVAKFVARDDTMDDATGIRTIRVWSLDATSNIEAYLPKASFAGPRERPETAPNPRPPFTFYGTSEVIVRFHLRPDPDRPVFFQARAIGTPPAQDPTGAPRPCVYKYIRSGGRSTVAEGPLLSLSMEVSRDGSGEWSPRIVEPEAGEAGTGR